MNSDIIGKQRQAAHPNGTARYYPDNPDKEDIIGVAGEFEVGDRYNLKVDSSIRPEGDDHIDFKVNIFYKGAWRVVTIDVKTAQKAYHLFVKEWEIGVCADILILAEYGTNKEIKLLGWEVKKEMAKQPKKVFSSLGIKNYYKHCSMLRPMSELDKLLEGAEQIF